jgi:hypothetical protein
LCVCGVINLAHQFHFSGPGMSWHGAYHHHQESTLSAGSWEPMPEDSQSVTASWRGLPTGPVCALELVGGRGTWDVLTVSGTPSCLLLLWTLKKAAPSLVCHWAKRTTQVRGVGTKTSRTSVPSTLPGSIGRREQAVWRNWKSPGGTNLSVLVHLGSLGPDITADLLTKALQRGSRGETASETGS